MPLNFNVILTLIEGKACSDFDLFLNQIHACHHFGDRVFNLNSGIHFNKIKFHVLV